MYRTAKIPYQSARLYVENPISQHESHRFSSIQLVLKEDSEFQLTAGKLQMKYTQQLLIKD